MYRGIEAAIAFVQCAPNRSFTDPSARRLLPQPDPMQVILGFCNAAAKGSVWQIFSTVFALGAVLVQHEPAARQAG
eukprot:2478600-Pyramimonas_sp.AAC.1